jgi:hypothetical protein
MNAQNSSLQRCMKRDSGPDAAVFRCARTFRGQSSRRPLMRAAPRAVSELEPRSRPCSRLRPLEHVGHTRSASTSNFVTVCNPTSAKSEDVLILHANRRACAPNSGAARARSGLRSPALANGRCLARQHGRCGVQAHRLGPNFPEIHLRRLRRGSLDLLRPGILRLLVGTIDHS